MSPSRALSFLAVAALLLSRPTLAAPPAGAAAPGAALQPPDHVLARVGPRSITAAIFSKSFFDSDPTGRPRPDSAGRVTFLNTLVKRDVMALVAREVSPPLDFTARAELRQYTNSLMRNVLYQRMVFDSVTVTEEEVRKTYEQYKEDVRLEHLQVEQRQAAERIRADLVAKRITWNDAVQRYSMAEDRVRNGDLGWRSRFAVDPDFAQAIFTLEVGEFSAVFADPNGYHIARLAERKPGSPPAYEPIRKTIEAQIRDRKAGIRTRMIQERLLIDYKVQYDSANLKWASQQFGRPMKVESVNGAPMVSIDETVPEMAPGDTARVLARYAGGQISMGRVLEAYTAQAPVRRPALDTPDLVQGYVDVLILEPRMMEIARERGLERDSLVVQAVEFRREGMLMERLYADSVESRVRVDDAMRRKYYKAHLAEFMTYPRVRFAAFTRPSREAADSLKKQLLAGLKAEDLIRQDSLAGLRRGSIQERSEKDHGHYHKILFEELRPLQVSVEGPDRKGDYAILQLLSYDPGRQLSYEESAALVDDLVRHEEEERIFETFVARQRTRYKIEMHPELVMRIDLQAT